MNSVYWNSEGAGQHHAPTVVLGHLGQDIVRLSTNLVYT